MPISIIIMIVKDKFDSFYYHQIKWKLLNFAFLLLSLKKEMTLFFLRLNLNAMQNDYTTTLELLESNLLLQLDLPEDKHFIKQTKSFQDEIKHLDDKLELSDKLVKKIHFISSELIQAVIHNGIFENELFTNNVKLGYSENKFYLMSQNLVPKDKIMKLTQKFEEVNSAFDAEDHKEELQLRYKYKLKNTPMTKSGISVGVLDLARRSLNKLLYSFELVSSDLAVFSIICTIDID